MTDRELAVAVLIFLWLCRPQEVVTVKIEPV